MGREGKEAWSHDESGRGNGEAGEGLELANPRRVRRRPEVEDEAMDDAAGLPVGRGSVERKGASRRSSGARRRGSEMAVAVGELVGGDGYVRVSEGEIQGRG